jgi:cysteine sulfinate desulfinase/cysteine desulfurase-like protein
MSLGGIAEKAVDNAREQIAKLIGASGKGDYALPPGATESQ